MSGIEEAKQLIKECIETQNPRLDLGDCGLIDLNKIPSLFECLHLEKLLLGSCSFDFDGIDDFSINEGRRNKIHDGLSNLSKIANLKELIIDGTYSDNSKDFINESVPQLGFDEVNDKIILSCSDDDEIEGDFDLTQKLRDKLGYPIQEINLTFLSTLHHLQNIQLIGCKLDNITELITLPRLETLCLRYSSLTNNVIQTLEILLKQSRLKKLDLSSTNLSKKQLDQLRHLSNLSSLNISNNDIENLNFYRKSKTLIALNCSENIISDLTFLDFTPKLERLYLDENRIYDIGPVQNLNNLRQLFLQSNRIVNFFPLLKNKAFKLNTLKEINAKYNPNSSINETVEKGYNFLKNYYDSLAAEGTIQNDQLKVILLGNSTAGKTSLVNYWSNKEFTEKQTTTHGIYTPMELPLKYESEEGSFSVNVWDFGGQDYHHATHRLFVTRDSTYILVCNQSLENKPEQELTTEYIQDGDETKEIQVKVQHYPYRYWLQTLTFLTKSGKIDDAKNQDLDKTKLPKLFLVENKCGTYEHNQYMRLQNGLSSTLPFEVINQDFFQLDIREAWRHKNLKENDRKARKFNDNYEEFEEKLIEVLQSQIKENRYEVHKNYPIIRDILASMAEYQQNTIVPDELNQILIDSKIAPLESYEKLPVWITYAQYEDLVRKNSLSAEPHFESLHIYLQNLCGRIFHFKDIPALADIVFIDPNWLHQTIYKVLSQEVLDNQGEFTLEGADAVIDGNILDAATFMEAMMAFDLVFEIPHQSPRRFIAPQYLPNDCPLSEPQLKKYQEVFHELGLTLEFPYYLPPSLISRIITQKGHLIKAGQEPLWRNGLIYTEDGISVFVFCQPTERKIEIYLGKNTSIKQKEMILREFMQLLENRFSDDIEEVLISLPNETGKAKWKDLYYAKKEKKSSVINYGSRSMSYNLDSRKYDFLFEQFENKPVNIFVCYAHDDFDEMVKFVEPLKREMSSFATQHQIKINPFTDQQLTSGMRWDDVLNTKIKENDILICLLSPSFFTSGYIQQNEYGQVMREIASGERDSLITPIYLKSCYVSESNPIANLQFFKPLSTNFVNENIANFSFNNLLGLSDDRLIDNYVLKFVESIKSNILEIWDKK